VPRPEEVTVRNNQIIDMQRQLFVMQLVVEATLVRPSVGVALETAAKWAHELVEAMLLRFIDVPLVELHRNRGDIRYEVEQFLAAREYLLECERRGHELDHEYLAHFDEGLLSDAQIHAMIAPPITVQFPRPSVVIGLASQAAGNLARGAVRNTRAVLSASASGVAQGMARTASRLAPKG